MPSRYIILKNIGNGQWREFSLTAVANSLISLDVNGDPALVLQSYFLPSGQAGQPSGVCPLDGSGVVPLAYLPDLGTQIELDAEIAARQAGDAARPNVTLTHIGSEPAEEGASLNNQKLTLQPASASFGGVVTTGAQTFAGAKTFAASVITIGTKTITMANNGASVAGFIITSAGSGSNTPGGTISTAGGSGTNSYGGHISTAGGSGETCIGGAILTNGGGQSGCHGGAVWTYGGTTANAAGGSFLAFGNSNGAGGTVDTSGGGGSISTNLVPGNDGRLSINVSAAQTLTLLSTGTFTLTVAGNASVSGNNTGDQDLVPLQQAINEEENTRVAADEALAIAIEQKAPVVNPAFTGGTAETVQTLTDGATVNWDVSLGAIAVVTIAGNRTIAAPTNLREGTVYIMEVIQDGTGFRTLTWDSVFIWAGGTAPTLTTTASRRDVFTFLYRNSKLRGVPSLNYTA